MSAPDQADAYQFPRKLWIALAVLVLLGFLGRLFYGYEVDELMHLHTAWSIGQGQVPYRDFYENHLPLWHHLAAPIVGTLTNANLSVLLCARLVALVVMVLGLICFYRLSKQISVAAAPLAVATYILVHPFDSAGFELRPDWTAMMCILASLLMLQEAKKPSFALGAGLLQGAAIGMTQKSLFLVFAVALWFAGTCCCAESAEERRHRIVNLLAMVVGIAMPIALLIGWYAKQGAARQLWELGILQNFRWMREDDVFSGAQESLLTNFPLFALAFVRLFLVLPKLKSHLRTASTESLISALLVAGTLAYIATPVPISQWFLFTVVPWAACLGAVTLYDFAKNPEQVSQQLKPLVLGLIVTLLALRWYNFLIVGVGWSLVLFIVWRKVTASPRADRRVRAAFNVILGIGAFVSLARITDEFARFTVRNQLDAIANIESQLTPHGAILAPWPNLAPFHPSPTFHAIAIGGIYTTGSVEALQDEYIGALKSGAARTVVMRPIDVEDRLPRFTKYVRDHGTLVRRDVINLRVVETYSVIR